MLVFYDAKNINLRKEKKESFACATFTVDYVQETVSLEMFLQTEVSSESAKKQQKKDIIVLKKMQLLMEQHNCSKNSSRIQRKHTWINNVFSMYIYIYMQS